MRERLGLELKYEISTKYTVIYSKVRNGILSPLITMSRIEQRLAILSGDIY